MSRYIGDYEIVDELGRGGMGVVYKAREESLQRFVAIKMLGSQLVDNESIALRFMREARAVADLNHPNVVQVFRVDRHEDQPYFVMEYVEGESLKQLIRRENKLQPMRALQILKEVGNGLAAAHDKGVIHRDIKPENIMLTKYGGVKVVDFGIARVEEPGTRLTSTGMGLGTPSYISPEVCLSQDVDQRSDIFSMGVVLFEMLTGDIPFKSDSPFEMMTKVVEAKIPNIKALNPNVDDGLKQILAKMIAKRPKLRYQNCNELISDIEDYLAGRVPRWSKNMVLEENEAAGTEASTGKEVGEDTERPGGRDTSTPATKAMPQPSPLPADTGASTDTVAVDSDSAFRTGSPSQSPAQSSSLSSSQSSSRSSSRSSSQSGSEAEPARARGGYLALVAMLVLLLAGGAIAGSWYLLSDSERPLLAIFDSTPDAGDEQRVAGTDDEGVPEKAAIIGEGRLGDERVVESEGEKSQAEAALVENVDAGFGPAVDEAATESKVPANLPEATGSFAATDSARDAGGTDFEVEAKKSMPRSSDQASDAERRVEPSSGGTPGTQSDASLVRAMSRPGESSGEALASVTSPGTAPSTPAESDAMPANPRVAVVAVGDASVAGTVAWEIKRALARESFDVMDEQLVEGLVYAESLAAVARTMRDAGASVLVYADVVPAGERELQFYGRYESQYLARVEVRVVDLHTQRNLGPVASEKLEYVAMTADRKAREAAAPIARNVVSRLRAARVVLSGADQG